jgi:hypothetical protein
MEFSDSQIYQVWEESEFGDLIPQVLRGIWSERIFYTVHDNKSIFYFISARKIKRNPGKERKSEIDAYITVAVPKKYCKKIKIQNNTFWEISDDYTPLTVSCPREMNDLQGFIRQEIASYFDNYEEIIENSEFNYTNN